jgi:hypothetical protein
MLGLNCDRHYTEINSYLTENLNYVKTIIEYIPNAYLIDTANIEPSVAIYKFIKRQSTLHPENANLVFTTSKLEYQLAELPHTGVISVRGSHSHYYERSTLLTALLQGCKTQSTVNMVLRTLSHNFYVPTLAIAGYKGYGIPGIPGKGYITVLKQLATAVQNNALLDIAYHTMDDIIAAVYPQIDVADINRIYTAIYLPQLSSRVPKTFSTKIKEQMIDSYDNYDLMTVNNQQYEEHPIMLLEIMEGE